MTEVSPRQPDEGEGCEHRSRSVGRRYLVHSRRSRANVWIALEVNGRLYCYLPASGRFHLNRGLTSDWLWDRDLDYEAITAARVRELMAVGAIGALDPVEHSALVSSLLAAQSLTDDDLNIALSAE